MPPRMPDHDPLSAHTPIPLPRTPESGWVRRDDLEEDIRDITSMTPPAPKGEPGYDPAYEEAYYATRDYNVDSVARYAAQDVANFNEIASDLQAERSYLSSLADDDPERPRIERNISLQSEALAPVVKDAIEEDPNMTVNIEECQRTVRSIIDRVAGARREHEVKGEYELLRAVKELQTYAQLNLGEVIVEQIDASLEAAYAAYQKTRGKRPGLVDKTREAEAAARRAEAAAGHVDEPEPPTALRAGLRNVGRTIAVVAGGDAASISTREKHRIRDEDAAKEAAKISKSHEAASHAATAVAQRKHGIAQFDEQKLTFEEMNDKGAYEAIADLRKILVDEATGGIITEHRGTSAPDATAAQVIDDLKNASPEKTVPITGEPDPIASARHNIEVFIERERQQLYLDITQPDSLALEFARVDRLYRHIDMIDDDLERLSVDHQQPIHRLNARLQYSQLMVQRRLLLTLHNQAAAHYGQHTIERATMSGTEPSGLPMHIIEDGGVLIGSDAIHWQNGDHAVQANPEYKGRGVFNAITHRPDGTAVNHGRFVRFSPDGRIRGEWPESYPSAGQLRQLDQQRMNTRNLYNRPGGYDLAEAQRSNIDARRAALFSNFELPTEAENFITAIDRMTGILLQDGRATASDPGMQNYFNYQQNHDRMEENRRARIVAGAEVAEIVAIDAAITRLETAHRTFITTHAPQIARVEQNARVLNNHRFLTLRAAAYNGRTTLLEDGTVVLPQEQPRDLRGMPSLHELLGLPDGTWRISPDGTAAQIFNSRDRKVPSFRRNYRPQDLYVRAA